MDEPRTRTEPPIAVVAGDVTMDWNLAHRPSPRNEKEGWTVESATWMSLQCGGAAMLGELIEAVAGQLAHDHKRCFDVRWPRPDRESVRPDDPRYHHSYAIWAPFKVKVGEAEREVWRASKFMGLDLGCGPPESAKNGMQLIANDTAAADLLVLDDANLGFRDLESLHPKALYEGNPHWIVLKLARPVAQGKFWKDLLARFAERLIVVMMVEDLRRSQVQISRRLSWERTAQDLMWELVFSPRVKELSQCARTIVSFGSAGAVLFGGGPESGRGTLLFDPEAMEGDRENYRTGMMIGYTTTLTAGIVRQIMLNPERPDFVQGIQSGIAGMRELYAAGYRNTSDNAEGQNRRRVNLAFPTAAITHALAQDKKLLATVAIKYLPSKRRVWTIIEDSCLAELQRTTSYGRTEGADLTSCNVSDAEFQAVLLQVAERIVLKGREGALCDVPFGRFGDFVTLDRREIEALRSIQSLIAQYCEDPRTRPLSIAVFGPPGSGKSFAVKQVAKTARKDQIETMEFNLSQFTSTEELLGAFHQVRDKALKGKIPLVFWDEFDTKLGNVELGWLRFFLAPMQEGTFQEGQITHPIGKSIFVFAGGTSADLESFGRGTFAAELQAGADSQDQQAHLAVAQRQVHAQQEADERRKVAKVPDFVSRLKGFLNILGPNESSPGDPYFVIRRALQLRSILEMNYKRLFDREDGTGNLSIDEGVLRAFLRISRYKHGTRSIESIAAMSQLANKASFDRSSLPSKVQLDLHVNGREFSALVQMLILEDETLERLAVTAHDRFCEHRREEGYTYGPVTDEKAKTHNYLMPYAKLPEETQRQNRGQVLDMPVKLAYLGCLIVPAHSNDAPRDLSRDEIETLAQREHQRWMDMKTANGWRYGPERDEEGKRHPSLLLWSALPESEKEKDREAIRDIPVVLRTVGYAIADAS